jgi:hypothetical protein
MERTNLKEISKMQGKEEYQVKTSNRSAALENLDDNVYVNRAWEIIRESIKMSAKNIL